MSRTMGLNSRDRILLRDNLQDTRNYGREVAFIFVVLTQCPTPGCGYDPLHDSAINPSDPVCKGLGRLATYAPVMVHANIRVVDDALIAYRQAPPGTTLGSNILSISWRDKPVADKMFNEKDSYIWLDGSMFRPTNITAAGLGEAEEWVLSLKSYLPIFRAPGY